MILGRKFWIMSILVVGITSSVFGQSIWNTQNSGTTINLTSAVWTGKQWVAVGYSGVILTSQDGLKWTSQTSGTTAALLSVIWTGSKLVAVGGSQTYLTSLDGVTWNSHSMSFSPERFAFDITSIAFSGSRYVATTAGCDVPNSSSTCVNIITSADEINWAELYNTRGGTLGTNSVIWVGSQFLMIISNGIFISSDGATWHGVQTPGNQYLYSITRTDSIFVAVGNTSSSGIIQTSPDGQTWTTRSMATHALYSVVWSGKLLVSVGNAGIITTSPNGVNWSQQNSPTGNVLNSVALGSNQLLAVGDGGTILTSSPSNTSIIKSINQNLLSVRLSPSRLFATLPYSFSNSQSSIAIYTASGSKLVEKTISSKSDFSFPINGLGHGGYFLKVENAKGRAVESFQIR